VARGPPSPQRVVRGYSMEVLFHTASWMSSLSLAAVGWTKRALRACGVLRARRPALLGLNRPPSCRVRPSVRRLSKNSCKSVAFRGVRSGVIRDGEGQGKGWGVDSAVLRPFTERLGASRTGWQPVSRGGGRLFRQRGGLRATARSSADVFQTARSLCSRYRERGRAPCQSPHRRRWAHGRLN